MSSVVSRFARQIARGLVDVILPRKCLLCNGEPDWNDYICGACYRRLVFIADPRCGKCGKPVGKYSALERRCLACRRLWPAFTQATAPLLYTGAGQELIVKLKYERQTVIAHYLGDLLADRLAQMPWLLDIDIVQPVPMHWLRRLQRGFNQSQLLAEALCQQFGLRVSSVLFRSRYTRPQARLSRRSRMNNLADAFRVIEPEKVSGRTVLLVDDVMTTGATCSECARTLKASGAKAVYALTVAKTR